MTHKQLIKRFSHFKLLLKSIFLIIMKIIFLLNVLTIFYNSYAHECIHHRIVKSIGKIDKNDPKAFFPKIEENTSNQRRLEENTWRRINIKFDTSLVENISDDFKTYIINVALPIVREKFESFTYVQGSNSIRPFSSTLCDNFFRVPNSYSQNPTDADLLIFVNIIDERSNFLAFATACRFEPNFNRPVVGLISINKTHLKISAPELQSFVSVLTHEAFHILILSPSLYDIYNTTQQAYTKKTKTTSIGTSTIYKLTSPKLLAAAQEQFGCDSLEGVHLENEGSSASAGAHFEKSHMGNELMTSQLTGFPVLSKLTLSLMEDSGWYKVDYDKAQHLAFGYKGGCGFILTECGNGDGEFCTTKGAISCSKDYISKTQCSENTFSDGCLINEYISRYVCINQYNFASTANYEENGPMSRCFITERRNDLAASCFISTCEDGKVIIQIEETSVECTTSGEVIEYKDTKITCPDISDFCNKLANACPNDCNGYGTCLVDGTCRCDYFHEGTDCSTYTGCQADADTICAALESSNSTNILQTAIGLMAIMLLKM